MSVRPRDLDEILLCTHERVLPDLPTLHTRMLLVAWELELDAVTENSAELLMLALRVSQQLLYIAMVSINQTIYWSRDSDLEKRSGIVLCPFSQHSSPTSLLIPTLEVQGLVRQQSSDLLK